MAPRKATAVIRLTITREIEFIGDDEFPGADEEEQSKAIEKAIEEKYGPLTDEESSDEPDEYEVLFADWDE